MIDLQLLREKPEQVLALLHRKDPAFPGERLVELDKLVRAARQRIEELRHEKNQLAAHGAAGLTQELREKSKHLGEQIKLQEDAVQQFEREFKELALAAPNIPDQSIPLGNKEANKVVKVWGEKRNFSFTPKNHVELNTKLAWFDFALGAQMASSHFVFYTHEGTRMIYSLAMMMLGHNSKQGFSLALPPYVVNEKSLEGAGQFPKFKNAVYAIPEDGLYLTPTSEVNLANVYRDHIFAAADLPVRMTSWTSCFRREAGTYGATERGLIRIHQFEKVELYSITTPEKSEDEQEHMLACAEALLQKLGLHYRVSLLAAQDCSFASAKTYDLEVWMPGQNAYYEVSSISNCTDFQARRCAMRYRAHPQEKPQLVHTLNASSLALPRLMVALMENYQQEDGTVVLPQALESMLLF
jgi:seryl-tRNA synthetase